MFRLFVFPRDLLLHLWWRLPNWCASVVCKLCTGHLTIMLGSLVFASSSSSSSFFFLLLLLLGNCYQEQSALRETAQWEKEDRDIIVSFSMPAYLYVFFSPLSLGTFLSYRSPQRDLLREKWALCCVRDIFSKLCECVTAAHALNSEEFNSIMM